MCAVYILRKISHAKFMKIETKKGNARVINFSKVEKLACSGQTLCRTTAQKYIIQIKNAMIQGENLSKIIHMSSK